MFELLLSAGLVAVLVLALRHSGRVSWRGHIAILIFSAGLCAVVIFRAARDSDIPGAFTNGDPLGTDIFDGVVFLALALRSAAALAMYRLRKRWSRSTPGPATTEHAGDV